MRWGSPIAIALFALALAAAAFALARWYLVFSRASNELDRVGDDVRADRVRHLRRTLLLWVCGTLLFTAAFWFAVCRDLERGPGGPYVPTGERLP